MEWINLKPEERLSSWRNFRKDLENVSDNYEQLERISKYFDNMPFVSRNIDYYDPLSWSDPWEILYENKYCFSSISLLIYYTTSLLPNFKMDKKLYLVNDNSDIYLLPCFEKKYILNYEFGEITIWQDIKNNIKVLDKFNDTQIKKII